MQDVHIDAGRVTPELLDRFPVVRATAGDGLYEELRPDRRLARMYAPEADAELTQPLPTLWIRVAGYGGATLAPLQQLVDESDSRRRARSTSS